MLSLLNLISLGTKKYFLYAFLKIVLIKKINQIPNFKIIHLTTLYIFQIHIKKIISYKFYFWKNKRAIYIFNSFFIFT